MQTGEDKNRSKKNAAAGRERRRTAWESGAFETDVAKVLFAEIVEPFWNSELMLQPSAMCS